MRKFKIKQNGFTLIEMMFVITVIAVMASLAVMTYRRHAETARIDKVAIEMQQVLEAALAYNVDHNQWPQPHEEESLCAMTQPSEPNPFVDHYIPNRNIQSSYGSYFCWGSQGTTQKTARLFWVALKVSHNNVQLAKRIAARLPNAVLTSKLSESYSVPCNGNGCYVRAEVVQPATISSNNGGGIIATGDCPSHNDETNSNKESSICTRISSDVGTRYRISFNACPKNALPRVTVFPNFINWPRDNWPGYTVKSIDAERTNDTCTVTTDDDGKRKQHCDVSVHVTFCAGGGPDKCKGYNDITQVGRQSSEGASYVVACIPAKVP